MLILGFKGLIQQLLIRFGFCDIQNNQGRGKCYRPRPSQKNSANNCLKSLFTTIVLLSLNRNLILSVYGYKTTA